MKKAMCMFLCQALAAGLTAQDTVSTHVLGYDPERQKIIPDKFFEFGLPLLLIYMVLHFITDTLKNRTEARVKEKMIERGISEESLLKIFGEADALVRLQPLKWFLFALANGLALLVIHVLRGWLVNQSGYFAVGLILIFNALAFALYYRRISPKE